MTDLPMRISFLHQKSLSLLPSVLSLALLLLGASSKAADLRGNATAANRPLADAVVWLDAPNAPQSPKQKTVTMDQRNLTFIPRVLAVQAGTAVKFPNNDRVFHNVFSLHDGKKFDLGLYPVGSKKVQKFNTPGLSRIFCNIHPNMAAYIMVVDTPYFAVSDKKGRFTLSDVPGGTYTYHAWRPGGTPLKGTVTVSNGVSLKVNWP
jgi:plastocyanin